MTLKRVRSLLVQADAGGIDVPTLLTSLDLPASLLTLPEDEVISLSDYYRIQNRLAILFGDETCHLSERQLLPGSTDFVLRNVGDCNNLYEVMQVIAESYNLLHGGSYNSVSVSGDTVNYIIDDSRFPYIYDQDTDDVYFAMECTLIFLHCMLMTVAPDRAPDSVRRLSLKRPVKDTRCLHLTYWAVPVRFNALRYRVCFDAEVCLQPIVKPPAKSLTSNAVQLKIIEAVNDRQRDDELSVHGKVVDALLGGNIEQHAIAAELGMSVATLRRRLGEEGYSFRQVRQDVLNETAKRLLNEKLSIQQVSDALGFAEFRSFNRAFKSWNGITPKAYMIDQASQ